MNYLVRVAECAMLGVLCLCGNVGADDFSGFRVPRHRVYSLTAYGSGWGQRNYGTNSQTNLSGSNSNSSTGWHLEGEAGTDGYWLYDSDPLRLNVVAAAAAEGEIESSRTRNYHREESIERSLTEDWTVITAGRAYAPWFPVGLNAKVTTTGSYEQNWNHQFEESPAPLRLPYSRHFDERSAAGYDYRYTINAGPGIGRVRDVTSVFDVYVLEKRLRERGVLQHELSKGARQKLIDLMYFRGGYAELHDRPEKFFWQQAEEILAADSALPAAGLDAYDLYLLAEPYFQPAYSLPEVSDPGAGDIGWRERDRPHVNNSPYSTPRLLRQAGWFAGFMVNYSHARSTARSRSSNRYFATDSLGGTVQDTVYRAHSHGDHWSDYLTYGPQVEYHRPFGPRWQFDHETSFRISWDRNAHTWWWDNESQISFLMTDRWLAKTSLHVSWNRYDQWSGYYYYNADHWSLNVYPELHFFVEDHATLYVEGSLNEGQAWNSGSSGKSTAWTAMWQVRVGFTYRFLGALDAPGIASSSLLPWPSD